MNKKIFILLLLVLCFPVSLSAQEKITKKDVKSFLRSLEIMLAAKDIVAYRNTFTEDFKIVIFSGNLKAEDNGEEHIQALEAGFNFIKDYSYKFKILNIKIIDNEAVVKGRVIEKITYLSGQTVHGKSDSKVTLKKVDGKIKQKYAETIVIRPE